MNALSRSVPARVASRSMRLAAAAVLAAAMTTAAHAQQNFSSPQAAMDAFGDAVVKDREDALRTIFGSDFRELIPPVGARVRETFVAQWAKSHTIAPDGPTDTRADRRRR